MAQKKLRVGVLFGGRSGEHEISLRSARSILKAIDRKKYDVVELGISKEGRWLRSGAALALLTSQVSEARPFDKLRAGSGAPAFVEEAGLSIVTAAAEPGSGTGTGLDVVFPVLHGTFGEDGTVQGLFELADVA
jgi:D-alanine-D-alanine ligase